MADPGYDHAVCGSSPLAWVLAGLLASAEGKRVCLVGEPWSPYRLPRRFDLSVAVATRPETWSLLGRETPEVLKLLNGIGRNLFERIDPLFVAETGPSTDRIGHMRGIAAASGYAAERAVDPAITASGTICRIRDAAMLVAGRVEPALEDWMVGAGVARFAVRHTALAIRRDGSATLTHEGRTVEAGSVILADDEAILTHQRAGDRHRLLAVVPQATIVSEPPPRSLGSALVAYLDRRLSAYQRAGKGPVTAIAAGDPDTVLARVGASIATAGPLQRSGQAVYRSIETLDGAPLVGRSGRNRLAIVAGLGPSAVFVAPALARYLAGRGTDDDRSYFEARDVSKAAHRRAVAETEASAEAAA